MLKKIIKRKLEQQEAINIENEKIRKKTASYATFKAKIKASKYMDWNIKRWKQREEKVGYLFNKRRGGSIHIEAGVVREI